MNKQQPAHVRYVQPYRYPSPNVPLTAINRFAHQIADKFQPEKIILFGSYAYGTPHTESDVDLLVIMPARNAIDQAARIDGALERPFALDLIVRTPRQIEQGLCTDDCDWFLREIIEKGKVLYEAPHRGGNGRSKNPANSKPIPPKRSRLPMPTGWWRREQRDMKRHTAQWVRKAEEDWQAATSLAAMPQPNRDAVCFHCQQAAEKYQKALLQEFGAAVPRTHDLEDLLDLLLPHDATLSARRRDLRSLTKHAVDYRYPGRRATTRQMQSALRIGGRVRVEVRTRLGLPP